MAALIPSMDTIFSVLPNSPFNSVTDRVTAMNSYRPGITSTNSTRSPALTFSACRMGAGMVIWPLLVTVAVVLEISFSLL